MELELELRDHSKIAAATTNRPEQVRVVLLTRAQNLSIRRNNVGSKQIVNRHAIFAREPTKASTQRQAGYSGCGIDSHRSGERMFLDGSVEVTKCDARLHICSPGFRFDMDMFHAREI